MQSTNQVDENIRRLGELLPNYFTEWLAANGRLEIAIDFDQLRWNSTRALWRGQRSALVRKFYIHKWLCSNGIKM